MKGIYMDYGTRLLKDIDKITKSQKSDTYTLKGVEDLTIDDIEMLKCYARIYASTECCPGGFLPRNEKVKEVLTIYGLLW